MPGSFSHHPIRPPGVPWIEMNGIPSGSPHSAAARVRPSGSVIRCSTCSGILSASTRVMTGRIFGAVARATNGRLPPTWRSVVVLVAAALPASERPAARNGLADERGPRDGEALEDRDDPQDWAEGVAREPADDVVRDVGGIADRDPALEASRGDLR